MPRRSARIKNEEQKDIEAEIGDIVMNESSELKATKLIKKTPSSTKKTQNKINKQSVSNDDNNINNNVSDHINNAQIEQKEQSESVSAESSVDPAVTTSVKRLSIDPETALPPILALNNDDDNENDIDMCDIDEYQTLAQTRVRRKRATISYKDESSEEDNYLNESSDDEDNNPLFVGLSKQERQELRNKMAGMHNDYSDAIRKERQLKMQEIICAVEFNIGQKISNEEAGFMYDFCRKYQWDVNDKVEEEGEIFLINIREMMEEKKRLVMAGVRANKNKKKKGGGDDSESEFDLNDYEYSDDDSDFSCDSEWDNPDLDNENMISDDEFGGRKKKRRRNKNTWRDPRTGQEYRAAGRLLLDDALKDTENFEGWSAARVQAWKNKTVNPNAYYYRFNDPGVSQKNGPVLEDEHENFMKRVKECGVNVHWGTFSMKVPGRVGYQCSNYWRQMMKDGWVKDPNYWIRSDGSFQFKRLKKGSMPDSIRKYSFVVLKDPSKTFGETVPAYHPKRPTDKQLSKYLQENVKELTEKQKKGKGKGKGKGKKKGRNTNNSNKNVKEEKKDESESENTNSNSKKEEMSENENSNNMEVDEAEKKSKKKKKKSKKKEKNENENDSGDVCEEGKKTKKKKSKKKKKDKKDKKSKKKSKKDKKDKKSKKKKHKKDRKDKKSKKSKKSKKNKNKKEEKCESGVEGDNDDDIEMSTEGSVETNDDTNTNTNKNKNDKKRKRNENGEISELEPPQKKRKIIKSKKNEKEEENSENENEKENDSVMDNILGDMVDIMTGDKLSQPAISPYGYVMDYNSWCSILRNATTKNKCPFTQQKMTRRSLVKLDENNIEQYKDKIVNITDNDMKKFKKTS